MCRFFQWADQLPVDVSEGSSPPQGDMLNNYIPRPKLQRQFAVLENWHLWTFTLIYNIIIIITFVCKLCLYVINFVICALENVCWYFFYKNFPLRLNYLLKTGLTRSRQAMSLVLRQVFVLSLYKRDITRLVGRYIHSTTTHTFLLKTHVIFNNKKLLKQ